MTAVPGATLVVEDLSVAYGDNLVLDELSLSVAAEETVAVVGPSGSGKSTLLRAIAGLEPLQSGRVFLGGRDLEAVPTHRRGVGLMFQDHALFGHLDVADNVGYGLDREGMEAVAKRARVDAMLELVGLTGFGGRRIDQLSGGEAQRVALARALAPAPSLLMLDEPLGSLDRALREQLVADLGLLLGRMGQTSLHVTHDQAEAFALADRVAVLTDGRLIRIGTPQELWTDPQVRFVAEFLGRPNIWTIEFDERGQIRWPALDQPIGSATDGAAGVAGLGRTGRSHDVVVPVDAITVVDDDPGHSEAPALLRGTVASSQFHQGRQRHRIDTDVEGVSFTMVDSVTRPVGQALAVAVDLSALILLRG